MACNMKPIDLRARRCRGSYTLASGGGAMSSAVSWLRSMDLSCHGIHPKKARGNWFPQRPRQQVWDFGVTDEKGILGSSVLLSFRVRRKC